MPNDTCKRTTTPATAAPARPRWQAPHLIALPLPTGTLGTPAPWGDDGMDGSLSGP